MCLKGTAPLFLAAFGHTSAQALALAPLICNSCITNSLSTPSGRSDSARTLVVCGKTRPFARRGGSRAAADHRPFSEPLWMLVPAFSNGPGRWLYPGERGAGVHRDDTRFRSQVIAERAELGRPMAPL